MPKITAQQVNNQIAMVFLSVLPGIRSLLCNLVSCCVKGIELYRQLLDMTNQDSGVSGNSCSLYYPGNKKPCSEAGLFDKDIVIAVRLEIYVLRNPVKQKDRNQITRQLLVQERRLYLVLCHQRGTGFDYQNLSLID